MQFIETKNKLKMTAVFGVKSDPIKLKLPISNFTDLARMCDLAFYPEDKNEKIYLIQKDNFDSHWSETKCILTIHEELIDMNLRNIIKEMNCIKDRSHNYLSVYLDLTNCSDEEISYIMLKWTGILYDRKNRSI